MVFYTVYLLPKFVFTLRTLHTVIYLRRQLVEYAFLAFCTPPPSPKKNTFDSPQQITNDNNKSVRPLCVRCIPAADGIDDVRFGRQFRPPLKVR